MRRQRQLQAVPVPNISSVEGAADSSSNRRLSPRQIRSVFVNQQPSQTPTASPHSVLTSTEPSPTSLALSHTSSWSESAESTPSVSASTTTTSSTSAPSSSAQLQVDGSSSNGGAPNRAPLIAGVTVGGVVFLLALLFILYRYRNTIRQHFRPVKCPQDADPESQQKVKEGVCGSGHGSRSIAVNSEDDLLLKLKNSGLDWDHTKTYAPPSSAGVSVIEKPQPASVRYRLPLYHVDDNDGASAYEAIDLDPFTDADAPHSYLSPPGIELTRGCSVKTVSSARPRLVTPTPSSRSNDGGSTTTKKKKYGQEPSSNNMLTAAALAWWEASGTSKSPEHRRRYSRMDARKRERVAAAAAARVARIADRSREGEGDGGIREDDEESEDEFEDACTGTGTAAGTETGGETTAASSRRPSVLSSQRASFFSVASSFDDRDVNTLNNNSSVALPLTYSPSTRSSAAMPTVPTPPVPAVTHPAAVAGGGHEQSQSQPQPQQGTPRRNSFFGFFDKGFDFGFGL